MDRVWGSGTFLVQGLIFQVTRLRVPSRKCCDRGLGFRGVEGVGGSSPQALPQNRDCLSDIPSRRRNAGMLHPVAQQQLQML